MSLRSERLVRHGKEIIAGLLLVAGTVALVFAIIGAYDRSARVDEALTSLCSYQRGNTAEGTRRFEFSQTIAMEDARGWRDAARARRVNAVEAAAAGHLSAARSYLETADEYDAIADHIDAAAARINKRPPPPCPS